MREQEGFIPVVGVYRICYRMVGGGAERENIPLLALHGGPGVPQPLHRKPCGIGLRDPPGHFLRSARGAGVPINPTTPRSGTSIALSRNWDSVRRELGLERIHLFGQAWGGMLAIEVWCDQARKVSPASSSLARCQVCPFGWVYE